MRELNRPVQRRKVLHSVTTLSFTQFRVLKFEVSSQIQVQKTRAPDQRILIFVGGDGVVVIEIEENQRSTLFKPPTVSVDTLFKVREISAVPIKRIVRHRKPKRPCVNRIRGQRAFDFLLVLQVPEGMTMDRLRFCIGEGGRRPEAWWKVIRQRYIELFLLDSLLNGTALLAGKTLGQQRVAACAIRIGSRVPTNVSIPAVVMPCHSRGYVPHFLPSSIFVSLILACFPRPICCSCRRLPGNGHFQFPFHGLFGRKTFIRRTERG